MRKTSQDGGDSTSVTSGVENEIMKPILSILKPKKNSLKRTAPNIAEETDETVVEPLLQREKDQSETQSAKYFAKAKADTVKEISKLFNDKKAQNSSTSCFGTTETLLSEQELTPAKSKTSNNAPIRNYMNMNIFNSHDTCKTNGSTKSQMLVEIDGSKQSGYNPSPLIFTTAKIHMDGKSKHMEPFQTTHGPILSTVELNVSKGGTITTNEKKISNGTSVNSSTYSQPPVMNDKAKGNLDSVSNTTSVCQSKDSIITDKTNASETINLYSNNSDIRSPSSATKAISPTNVKDNSIRLDVTKKHDNEPRILMSESKLKSSMSDNTKHITSIKPTQPAQKPTNNKNENLKSEYHDVVELDKSQNEHIKGTQQLLNKNMNSPSVTKEFTSKSSPKQSIINESDNDKNEKLKTQKNDVGIESDAKSKKLHNKGSQQSQNQNIQSKESANSSASKRSIEKETDLINKETLKSVTNNEDDAKSKNVKQQNTNTPSVTKEITSKSNRNPNIGSIKSTLQKDITITQSKVALNTDASIPKGSESLKEPSAKTLISSVKSPTQPKYIDSKISKETEKSSKLSANDVENPSSKISINNTAISPANKLPTASTVKPIPSVSSPSVTSSNLTDISNKTLNNSLLSDSKAITSTETSTSLSSTVKTQAKSTASITTANTKPSSVTSAKSSTKPVLSSVSSIKAPQTTAQTNITKQPLTSTAKTISKPSVSSTKATSLNTSGNMSTPAPKPTVSKIAQVSTIHSKGNANSPMSSSSTAAVANTKNNSKAKEPESNKKGGSKLSHHTKDSKDSKP